MARMPYADPAALSEDVRTLLAQMPPLNIFRMLAHADGAARAYARLGNAILSRGVLDPHLREMAILRVGHLSRAAYEIDQHDRISRKMGMDEAKISALADGPDNPVFSEEERLVLRFTEAVVHQVRPGDSLFSAAEALLGPRALVELVLAIGFYMLTARLLETFAVDLEDASTPTLALKGR